MKILFFDNSRLLKFLCLLLLLMAGSGIAPAAIFTVTKTDDTNDGLCNSDCSLREAIAFANATPGNNNVEFDTTVFSTAQTIVLTQGQLTLRDNNGSITINGFGLNNITISGNNSSRVFLIDRGAGVWISNLAIINGNGVGEPQTLSGSGGAILNLEGFITIYSSTISNNSARPFQNGGGICNAGGTTNVIYSTVNNNSALDGTGGGIYNFTPQGIVTFLNSTVSNNVASSGGAISSVFGAISLHKTTVAFNLATGSTGGGIINSDGSAIARNSIIANNSSGTRGADFFGTLDSQGWNLIKDVNSATITGTTASNILGQNPQLLPLGNYGGTTQTHALRPTSPAIDKGVNSGGNIDQRQKTRPFDNPLIPNSAGGDGSDIGAFERQRSDIPTGVVFDFDGDTKTDISVFRPAVAEWWYSRSSNGQVSAAQFGAPTDIPVPADFTGDGRTDIAVFRPSSGEWFVLRSEDSSFFSFPFGASSDVPLVGDFDRDGKADPGQFRPVSGEWFIQKSSGGVIIATFGVAGDAPVPADYVGDGITDIAIWRPSAGEWWIAQSGTGTARAFQFGASADKPVVGDWTGDGKADAAFFRPSTGEWFVLRSEDVSYYSLPFGASGDVPAPGDYDGDSKFDPAVFRPSAATWFVNQTTSGILITNFGANGDRPIPNIFVP